MSPTTILLLPGRTNIHIIRIMQVTHDASWAVRQMLTARFYRIRTVHTVTRKPSNKTDKHEHIIVKGARVHNLKDVDVSIPKNSLVVFCGVSGSGKSSLAFDTIFAEGQRRYIESLSSYARQFLGQIPKPDVDSIDGLSPAVSIDQRTSGHNPRSTVGTVTEIWDYLRLLYARVGNMHCLTCETLMTGTTVANIVKEILTLDGQKIIVSAPISRGKKGSYQDVLENYKLKGFTRVRIDGTITRIDQAPMLDPKTKHTLDLVIDNILVEQSKRGRITESIESAMRNGNSFSSIEIDGVIKNYSTLTSCPTCLTAAEPLEPKSFSFNSPSGACDQCLGLGYTSEPSAGLVVGDESLSIRQGALTPWFETGGWKYYLGLLEQLSNLVGFSLDEPYSKLKVKHKKLLLNGDSSIELDAVFSTKYSVREYQTEWEGLLPWLARRHQSGEEEAYTSKLSKFFNNVPCTACNGARLKPQSLNVRVNAKNICELASMSISDLLAWITDLNKNVNSKKVYNVILKEINSRLTFLNTVGLGYLSLDRYASTLSGGESQRIRLASQIGSGLTGVLYVLDEPSIGLHQKDNAALINTLNTLKDLGNTVIVVEHDSETMQQADWLVEVGKYAGKLGGDVSFSGTYQDLLKSNTITGNYLSGKTVIQTPQSRRVPTKGYLTLVAPRGNNLNIDEVKFPLGLLTVVTGVSGSGKSTLINDTLASALARKLGSFSGLPMPHKALKGWEEVDKLITIDQSPIGRTPRSNPATYTGVFDNIRHLYAGQNDSKLRGYTPGRFSFNVPASSGGGRCERCLGDGSIRVEMSFLPDIYVTCEECNGSRFNSATLEIQVNGKSISDVLSTTIDDCRDFFKKYSNIHRHIEVLHEVGLGYITLGQSATTLSGGEAQRVKLGKELLRRSTGKTVYILDEPTTGLHSYDISKLMSVIGKLVDRGNTAIIVEHNLDVIRLADNIIDLGPDGGPDGGRISAIGTPEEVSKTKTHTGKYLKTALHHNKKTKTL